MKVQILGTGCPKCEKLAEMVETVMKELGTEAEVVKVTDINEIMNLGVMMTPALLIDGETKSAGRLPSPGELREWLKKPGE